MIVGDEWEYLEVGKNLLSGKGFWNPERGGEFYFSEPIYPMLIALILLLFKTKIAIIIINSILSGLIIGMVHSILLRSNINIFVNYIAIFILILHPYLNYWNGIYMPEILRVFGLTLIIYTGFSLKYDLSIKKLLLFSIATGFGSLIRFPFAFMIPLLFIYLMIINKGSKIKLTYFIVIILIIGSPWLVRNYLTIGMLTKYSISERLKDGLKPETIYRITDNEKYLELGGNRGITNEQIIDIELRQKEIKAVFYTKLIVLRLWEFIRPYPSAASGYSLWEKFIGGLFNIPILILGIIGLIYQLVQKNWALFFLFGSPIVVLTLIHVISNAPHSRYSLPLLPIFVILGSLWLQGIIFEKKNV
jgi:4-amino-4-deoxy-L-arabinose transferase-like glycosyltransferase